MTKISNYNKNYLIAEDIICKDCNGNVFEKYEDLLIPKNLPREKAESGNPSPYAETGNIHKIVDMFEGTNKFLPSMALTFAITKACFNERNKHRGISKVLEQYTGNRCNYGIFLQNTFFETNNTCKIVHYPNKEDLLNGWNYHDDAGEFRLGNSKKILNSKMNQINSRVELSGHGIGGFDKAKNYFIEDLVKEESYRKHLTDLLGDEDFIGILKGLSKFLGKNNTQCITYRARKWNDDSPIFTGVGFGGVNDTFSDFHSLKINMEGYANASAVFRYVEKLNN